VTGLPALKAKLTNQLARRRNQHKIAEKNNGREATIGEAVDRSGYASGGGRTK
jgi:hypothetical protein